MAKLLIIEDDPFAQRMYQRLFAHQNHEVILADNGKEGFELALKRLPNLILVDILLPGISGLELLEKLKIEQSTKTIPVFVISNLAGEDVVADAKRLGAEEYIVKADFLPQQLLEEVNKYLTVTN